MRFALPVSLGALALGGKAVAEHLIVNWSGTHECRPSAVYSPSSASELEDLVARAHVTGTKLRPVGSSLSPNGVGFSNDAIVELGGLDRVMSVDRTSGLVRAESGITVEQLVDALRPYGLTLQNFASIKQQQLGGFLQVGVHGTGPTIPPVDEQVVGITLVTPALGKLSLDARQGELFRLARVGLGVFGVISEMTLQCVPAHQLLETTRVMKRDEVCKGHVERLSSHRHVRYMWLPYTDDVVVVTANPIQPNQPPPPCTPTTLGATRALVQLLQEDEAAESEEQLSRYNFAALRDLLLNSRGGQGGLDVNHIKRVNAAEAEYWRASQGQRVGWSDEILMFECGGQQLVCEVAFKIENNDAKMSRDVMFVRELLQRVEAASLPAPCPIEQRWTCGSGSVLSPAHGSSQDLFSWDPQVRNKIVANFQKYKELAAPLWDKYGAVEHWAKVEVSKDSPASLQRLAKRYDLAAARRLREFFDPKNILGTDTTDTLIPRTPH